MYAVLYHNEVVMEVGIVSSIIIIGQMLGIGIVLKFIGEMYER
jgi:hypothetical protein